MRTLIGITALAAMALPGMAQNQQRRATMVGGGNPDRGKCTVEVVVDGAAEVEIRGDTAVLRNLKGQMPQWRRFECSGVMPSNPGDFRFAGVDGRGSQQLVRDPRNGGVAVIQIQDPDNGREGYTFDIMWANGGGQRSEDRRPDYRSNGDDRNSYPDYRNDGNRRRDDDRDSGFRRGFSRDEAMRSCQDAVRGQASERFDPRDMAFRRLEANDNPGPRDSINGVFDVRRGNGRNEVFRFSCSVNFDSGRVFDVRIEPINAGRDQFDDRRR